MSVKEAVHKLVDEMPDDSPALRDLYERMRLNRAIDEAREDVRAGRVFSIEEVRRHHKERFLVRKCG